MLESRFTKALGLEYPIIQAGMANNNATTAELISAVSNAGGLGTLGVGYMAPEQIQTAITAIRQLTNKPFAVNLFLPSQDQPSSIDFARINVLLDPYREELGIPKSPTVTKFAEDFTKQLDVVLALRVPVCSFTFGVPDPNTLQKLKEAGIYSIATATTVQEAVLLEQAGVDAIVAQGSEAGGHRGTFAHSFERAMVGTLALVPQIVDHVSIPVIAAGGIMDGRGLAACFTLGASAVQMGTAFLSSEECGVYPLYKQTLLEATEDQTEITTTYSGKAARGIHTRFMEEMAVHKDEIPPYPIMNAYTTDIRKAAVEQSRLEFASVWAGQGLRMSQRRSARDIVRNTAQQANRILRQFQTDTF